MCMQKCSLLVINVKWTFKVFLICKKYVYRNGYKNEVQVAAILIFNADLFRSYFGNISSKGSNDLFYIIKKFGLEFVKIP